MRRTPRQPSPPPPGPRHRQAHSTLSPPEVTPVGNISAIYTRLDRGADVEAVAADLRNHGATILVVFCTDDVLAQDMHFALAQAGKGHRGDGDGEEPGKAGKSERQARPAPDEYQVQYTFVGHQGFIVAGRSGIVAEVTLREASGDSTHVICIAEIELRSSFCQILSFRVAGCSLLQTRGDGVEPQEWVNIYKHIGDLLSQKAVRVLAGEFHDHTGAFLKQMREQVCINIAAWLPYKQEDNTVNVSNSYMFVLGKVQSLQLAFTEHERWELHQHDVVHQSCASTWSYINMDDSGASTPLEDLSWPALPAELKELFPEKPTEFFVEQHHCGHGEDASKGWPVIPHANQKKVKLQDEHTEKLSIYLGSRQSRRSEGSTTERNNKRRERAKRSKWGRQPW